MNPEHYKQSELPFGFYETIASPLHSYDLLAILPFLLAALVAAGVRKIRRRCHDPR